MAPGAALSDRDVPLPGASDVERGRDDGEQRAESGVQPEDPQRLGEGVAGEVDRVAHRRSAGPRRQPVADRPPERRQERGGVGTARAGVAEDDEQDDSHADAEDAPQHLEGDGGRGRGEDDERPERPQSSEVTGQRAQYRIGDDRAAQAGEDGVHGEGSQADEGAVQVRRAAPLAMPRMAAAR